MTQLQIQLNEHCNVGCPTCFNSSTPSGGNAFSKKRIQQTLRFARARGVREIAFGGGEPQMSGSLDFAISEAQRQGFSVAVTTAMDPKDLLNKHSDIWIYVSMGGGSKKRDAATFEKLSSNRAHLKRIGVLLLLDRTTFSNLPRIATELDALGVKHVQFQRVKPVGRQDYQRISLTKAQGKNLFNAVKTATQGCSFKVGFDCSFAPFVFHGAQSLKDKISTAHFEGCPKGGRDFEYLNSNGEISECGFLESPKKKFPVPFVQCQGCPFWKKCQGGCQSVARAFYNGVNGPDPECPFLDNAIV